MFNNSLSPCMTCVMRTDSKNVLRVVTCQAYPNGIPKEIAEGMNTKGELVNHDSIRADQDNSIVFIDIETLSLEEIETIKAQEK